MYNICTEKMINIESSQESTNKIGKIIIHVYTHHIETDSAIQETDSSVDCSNQECKMLFAINH